MGAAWGAPRSDDYAVVFLERSGSHCLLSLVSKVCLISGWGSKPKSNLPGGGSNGPKNCSRQPEDHGRGS